MIQNVKCLLPTLLFTKQNEFYGKVTEIKSFWSAFTLFAAWYMVKEGLEGTCRTSLLYPFASKPRKAACGLRAGETRTPGLSQHPANVAGLVCIAPGSVRWSAGSGRESRGERSSGIAARFPFASPGPETDWQQQRDPT